MDTDIKQLLLEIYTEDQAEQWYVSENQLLGGQSAQTLVYQGRKHDVTNCINQLLDCVYL